MKPIILTSLCLWGFAAWFLCALVRRLMHLMNTHEFFEPVAERLVVTMAGSHIDQHASLQESERVLMQLGIHKTIGRIRNMAKEKNVGLQRLATLLNLPLNGRAKYEWVVVNNRLTLRTAHGLIPIEMG